MTQGIQEQSLTLPAVEAERHLIKVGLQMLCADLVPRADDAALEQRKCGLDRIRVDISTDVLFRLVVHGLVFSAVDSSFDHSRWVTRQFVGDDDFYIGADVFLDVLRQCARLRILSMEESQIAAALPDSDDNFFLILAVLNSFSSLLSSDVGFIHFDRASQHRLIDLLHCVPDSMTQIPCGFVRSIVLSPDRALKLAGTHAFLGLTEQQDSEKPLLQGQMRVVKDRASSDGELIIAFLAVEQLLFGLKLRHWPFAAHAFWTVRPAQADKQFTAFIVGVEQVDNVN